MRDIQVKDIKEGNRQAYYKAFEAFHAKLYRYIYSCTQSAYYAEETVQLTFIKLWERREALSDEYPLPVQLFRIAKSTLIDLLRKEERRVTRELSDIYIAAPEAEERTWHKEELQQVLSVINELPEQCRQVFTLSRFNELSHKEIGAQLSISPKTVEAHISKALKFLRKSLSLFL